MRTVSGTLETAQYASKRTPYIHMVFTTTDGLTTYDFSTDSSAYGDRIILIDHHEEAYNDYAIIIIQNYDLSVPWMEGCWTEIGYGDVTGSGNEYIGDGTSEGATARLWIKYQQYISAGGKLYMILELEGMWARLREEVLRIGNPPYYVAKNADGDFGGTPLTVYDLIDYIFTNEITPAMTLEALVEDDGIIDSYEPDFSLNEYDKFDTAGSMIYDLLKMTESFLRPKASLAWEIKFPQTSDADDLTYDDTGFYDFIDRRMINIPNRVYLFSNKGTDGLWTDIITSQVNDVVSQAKYYIVPYVALAPEITNQTDSDLRAAAILARMIAERQSSQLTIPHDCQMELYDRIGVTDNRGA